MSQMGETIRSQCPLHHVGYFIKRPRLCKYQTRRVSVINCVISANLNAHLRRRPSPVASRADYDPRFQCQDGACGSFNYKLVDGRNQSVPARRKRGNSRAHISGKTMGRHHKHISFSRVMPNQFHLNPRAASSLSHATRSYCGDE